MLSLFLAAAVATHQVESRAAVLPDRQAAAIVRVIRPARIRLGGPAVASEESVIRPVRIRDVDGTHRDVSLIEFF